jgi:hypothetical protein
VGSPTEDDAHASSLRLAMASGSLEALLKYLCSLLHLNESTELSKAVLDGQLGPAHASAARDAVAALKAYRALVCSRLCILVVLTAVYVCVGLVRMPYQTRMRGTLRGQALAARKAARCRISSLMLLSLPHNPWNFPITTARSVTLNCRCDAVLRGVSWVPLFRCGPPLDPTPWCCLTADFRPVNFL